MLNQEAYLKGNTKSAIRELAAYGTKRKQEIGAEKVYDFSLGNPSTPTPDCLNNAIKDYVSQEIVNHGYTNAFGLMDVREKISNNLKQDYEVSIKPENIYMTCGAAASLSIIFRAILNSEDEVILVAPFFAEYTVFIEANNGKCVLTNARNNDFQIDTQVVKNAISEKTKVVLINTPNNPVGTIYSEQNLKELSEVLKQAENKYQHPIYLISDEPYRELVYEGKFNSALKYYDDSIMAYSFSKSMALAGERIGYIGVNDKASDSDTLMKCIAGAGRMMGYVNAPILFQKTVSECLGHYSNLEDYRYNRDLLCKTFDRLGFEYIKPQGAFYIFIKNPVDDFYKLAMKHELLLVPSDSFGYKGYVRLAYCVTRKTVEDSIQAFEALKKDCEDYE